MKGLLIKDIQLTLSSKRTLPIFVFIAAMLLITGDEATVSFVVAFFCTMCGMMVLSTISYDEFDHSNAFLMTLPITRKIYTIEKYVFMLLALLFGWIISVLGASVMIQMRGYEISWQEWLVSCCAIFVVLFVLLSAMIPIQLKFGGDNGRIVILGIMAVVLILGFAGVKLARMFEINLAVVGQKLIQTLSTMNFTMLILLAAIVVIIIVTITLYASIRVVEKKEF